MVTIGTRPKSVVLLESCSVHMQREEINNVSQREEIHDVP